MTGLPLSLLKIACLMTIASGLVGALGAHPATAGIWTFLMDILQWPLDGAQSTASSEARVLSAVGGGVMCGWGLLLYRLAAGPIERGDRDARGMFLGSVVIWFVVDSTASLAAGWPGNVVLNLVFLGALTLPLLLGEPRSLAAVAR